MNAKRRNVGLRSSLETNRIHADQDLFRRTLTNLVENAIRFAPPETMITVTAMRRPSETEVRVTDRGSGIPEEMRERVFEAFAQAEAKDPTAQIGGRGLGLTFCKVAVEAQGGRIWIEDGAPGAIFCMRLPNDV